MTKLLGVNDSVKVIKQFDVGDGYYLPVGITAKVLCFNANKVITIKLDESGDVWGVPFEILERVSAYENI
jgi:hypothetical protein